MNEPTNRKPVYALKSRDRRVISVAGGLWQAQRRTLEKGLRERDNWQAVARPTTWHVASAQAQLEADQ